MIKIIKKFLVVITSFVLILYPASTAYAAKYTVMKNDSLYKISSLFKTTVNKIKTDNKLKTDTIYPGQKLEINAKTYTVKKGDTLSGIAKKYKITLASLKKANSISGSKIKVGQKLILPGIKVNEDSKSSSVNTAASYSTTSNSGSKNTAGSTTTSSNTAGVIPYTQAELDLLARLIEAEASGESYNAKVAVGAVVINRVQSKDWASSINGVINEKYGDYYQFSPVQNGMIKKPASDASIKAAREALTGKDPSKGAIFYYDSSSTNTWIRSKEVTARIGNLTFAK